ncbi:neurotrypsin-like [Diadema antillarum]|uniref:neurotrypsin-like n=1 Tax=Diadema antillarum TaxID=105358 RepID=UPI003A8B1E8B
MFADKDIYPMKEETEKAKDFGNGCELWPTVMSIAEMRLAGGSEEREGRVEISCNGRWGTVCDDAWDINDAHVVCRDLGYSSASAHYTDSHFGQGSGPTWLDEVACSGRENSLTDCPRPPWACEDCGHDEDAGVRCEGDRSDNAVATYANESISSGLGYGFNYYTYYNVRSNLTLTPTAADNGGVLQCHLIGSERSRNLQVQHAPADDIIWIKIADNEDGQGANGLNITCHVNPRDQPFPPMETYEIAIDDVMQSSSSSPSVTLESIPSKCVEISCTGINDIGRTTTTENYCPRSDE